MVKKPIDDEKLELDFTSTESTIASLKKVREWKHHLSNIQTHLEITMKEMQKSEKLCINVLIDGQDNTITKSIHYIPGRFVD